MFDSISDTAFWSTSAEVIAGLVVAIVFADVVTTAPPREQVRWSATLRWAALVAIAGGLAAFLLALADEQLRRTWAAVSPWSPWRSSAGSSVFGLSCFTSRLGDGRVVGLTQLTTRERRCSAVAGGTAFGRVSARSTPRSLFDATRGAARHGGCHAWDAPFGANRFSVRPHLFGGSGVGTGGSGPLGSSVRCLVCYQEGL